MNECFKIALNIIELNQKTKNEFLFVKPELFGVYMSTGEAFTNIIIN